MIEERISSGLENINERLDRIISLLEGGARISCEPTPTQGQREVETAVFDHNRLLEEAKHEAEMERELFDAHIKRYEGKECYVCHAPVTQSQNYCGRCGRRVHSWYGSGPVPARVMEIYKGEEIRGVDGPSGADLPKV